jgi:outer membrane protein assembly factor BamB
MNLVLLMAASLLLAETTAGENVPRFLTGRQLPADAASPPTHWSATHNIAWKTDVAGLAWSSPIVWDGKVYLTTCVRQGQPPEPKKGLYLEDLDARKYPPITDKHQWKLLCLDLETGSVLWEKMAQEAIPAKPHHIKNTLASETPCTDGERIYACFGNVGLFTYSMEGNQLWSYPIPPRETRYGWGTSQSPVVHDSKIYLCLDNEEDSHLACLDAKTGKVLWDVKRDEKTNYSTPFVWTTPQRTELVISGIGACQSYDLAGQPLWKIKGRSILAIPTPFEFGGHLYVTSGHVVWGQNPIYCVKPGATGDISPADPEKKENFANPDAIVWTQPTGGPYHPTPLIHDGIFYVLYDRGMLAAYDAKTGEVVYSKKRIPNGVGFTSSPWSYRGKLFAVNEDGITFVIRPGKEFKIEHTNALAEGDMCMATPVIVGDKLLVRTSSRLYCISVPDLPASPSAN